MRIAVTGATGFIGRHVMAALEFTGHEFSEAPRDVVDNPVGAFKRMGRPDALIHLAWEGLPNYGADHHTRHSVVQFNFLRQAIEEGLRSVVISGTCEEYGMAAGCVAETTPTAPVHRYASAKDGLHAAMDDLCEPWCGVTWARIFYPWGRTQHPKSLYPALRDAVLRRDKEFPMNGGEQVRDYLHVSDVADYLVALAGSDAGTVNVCSGEPITVRALVQRWIHANNWGIKPIFGALPYPDHEPMQFWGNNTKLLSITSGRTISGAARDKSILKQRRSQQGATP